MRARPLVLLVAALGLVVAGPATAARALPSLPPLASNLGHLDNGPFPGRAVTLSVGSTRLPAGAADTFEVDIVGVDCSSSATPPNQTVDRIEVAFGDSVAYMPPLPEGNPSCTSSPWVVTASLSYGYRSAGTYNASATIHWKDGFVATSPSVVVQVGAPPEGVSPSLIYLLVGGAGISAIAALFVLLFRRRPRRRVPTYDLDEF